MSTKPGRPSDTTLIFEKFKDYFDQRFNSITTPQNESSSLRELKNKLEARELSKAGNIAQFEFCGKIELALDKIKEAITEKSDIDSAIEVLRDAELLVAERKRKIRIADQSKAGWATVSQLDKKDTEHLTSEQLKSVRIAEEEALKQIESR